MDKTRDAALEVLATWCNEKGIGQNEYRRRCKEYDKHTSHDELVAAVKQAERWMRNIPTDEQFDCAAYGESITGREICAQLAFVLRKATAQ